MVDYGPGTVDGLREHQLERLRATLDHVYNQSAHYRRLFNEAGVAPSDLRALEDIGRFPFTTKADLRENYPFGMMCVPMEELARLHASSGTTGQPTVVGYTASDLANWASLVARSLHAAGIRSGMKVHVSYGYGLFTGGLGAHYGVEALGCTAIPMSGGQTEKQVRLIRDFRPDVIMITPSYMLTMLDEFRRQGLDPRQTSLRYGIFGAEPWTEAMRREIEAAFNIEAYDIYGLSELMGPGVAQEIPGSRGLAIWEDHFLPEIVDPDTGQPLPDGEEGELVLTSLSRQAMPMIRYRTRDLTRLMPGERFPHRHISKITGRSDDMLIIRGVNVFPTQIEEQILKCPGLAPHFTIEITRSGRMDEVVIDVEPRLGVTPEQASDDARQLATLVKEMVGITVHVRVGPTGSLVRSTSKASHVRDLRRVAA